MAFVRHLADEKHHASGPKANFSGRHIFETERQLSQISSSVLAVLKRKLMLGGSIAYIPVLIFLAMLLIFAWWMDRRPR